MEARRTASAQTAPFCSYSRSPPLELKSVPASALKANAGYVSFGEPQSALATIDYALRDPPVVCIIVSNAAAFV